jgi:nucleotide-binding universal stress UspA family protein
MEDAMVRRPRVLCPIDFSTPSRAALRYATAVAEHFGAHLALLTVNDPLISEAAELKVEPGWLMRDSERELRRLFVQTFEHRSTFGIDVEYVVTIGQPAPEILRVARDLGCDLIVMSTHGLTGFRKLFFGATTERVLRETGVPVLLTPPTEPGPLYLEDVGRLIRRILVPVDLTASTSRQVEVAGGLAGALGVPLLLANVVEPVRLPGFAAAQLPSLESERRDRSEKALAELAARVPPAVKTEAVTAFGDPAEEIAKFAQSRHVGLIVIGLHASPLSGPRMGSVTYRVLCLTRTLVLALPPGLTQGVNAMATARTSMPVTASRAER